MRSWSPELQQAVAQRLGSLALLVAGVELLTLPLSVYFGFLPMAGVDYLILLGWVVASLLIFYWSRAKRFTPWVLLHVGYVYAVVSAFALGITVNKIPLPEVLIPAWSPVAVWAFMFPVIIPARPWKALLIAFSIAAMDPLSYLTLVATGSLAADGFPVARFLPNLVVVLLVPFVSRIVYQLGSEATKAQELGSYLLTEPLGKGGMGEVWRAEHRMLARPAAVKLIRPEVLSKNRSYAATVVQRFEREAQATAQLTSPNTVQIYDFGTTDDGTFFYVMELLDGVDLETMVKRHGPISPERTVHILRQAARSLREAHEHGLIHRDIKPANLFLCRSGGITDFVKLLDFGLVTTAFESDVLQDVNLTREGFAPCTPGYVAPEVASGRRDITGAADLYSLACVAYWMLTGEMVFDANTPMELIAQHVSSPPDSPAERSPFDVPSELDQLILQSLSKDPEERPQSARELERSLERISFKKHWTEDEAAKWWALHQPTRRSSSEMMELTGSGTLVHAVR
jgi:serine/threonine-protein kinase